MPQALPANTWTKGLVISGHIRGTAVAAPALIQDIANAHSLSDAESITRLGEVVLGSLLMASLCKDEERVNLQVRGNGFPKQVFADARPSGTVRACLNPWRDINALSDTFAFTGSRGPWGQGHMSVMRSKPIENDKPYLGSVPLTTGHLGKDLTYYLVQSEQTPSAVGMDVEVDDAGQVKRAYAFLVQSLPGATDADITFLEGRVQDLSPFREKVSSELQSKDLLDLLFLEFGYHVMEEKPVLFKCECSRERVRSALAVVGVQELTAMLNEDGRASVQCEFCSKNYAFIGEELQKLIVELQKRSTHS